MAAADENADIPSAPAPHVLVVPYPAQGHTIPLLDLAALLAARGLRLTVVATPATAPLLSPLLAAYPEGVVRALTLPFPSHPAFPAGVESAKGCPPVLFGALIVAFSGLHGPLLSWARALSNTPDRVVAVLSDFFCGWTQPLAADLGVPRIAFSSSAVYGTAVLHSLLRRLPKREDDRDEECPIAFPDLPGAPAFPWRQLTLLYRTYEEGDEVCEGVRTNFLWNLDCSAFVTNTFRRFEEPYLEAPLADLGFRPVRAVGPLAPEDADAGGNRGGETAVAAADLCAWLDGFEDGSVLYISFGSMAVLQPAHAAALAAALERTGAAFVWAVGPAVVLPEGFEERTAVGGRGTVIRGWAPQVAALRHRVVGWFVTHCGWNSVLEAAAAGVTILAWPMTADQFVNARLLVDELRAAVPVCWGGLATAPSADELVRVLEGAVAGEDDAGVAARAKKLAEEVAAAVREGGSSWWELEKLARELRDLGNQSREQML
jgi:UDP:flavonoid glycosyltransferase YjiC (YdhE family)